MLSDLIRQIRNIKCFAIAEVATGLMADTQEDHESEEPPRKGRSNAIATYELLASFDRKLTTIIARFDGSQADQKKQDDTIEDHEQRLRLVERTQTAYMAGSASSKSSLGLIWGGATFFATLILQVVTLYVYHK